MTNPGKEGLEALASHGVEWAIEELGRRDRERDVRVEADMGAAMRKALAAALNKEGSRP